MFTGSKAGCVLPCDPESGSAYIREDEEGTCRVCGNSDGNTHFTAREMMFGEGREFRYSECSRCGCLQLADVPEDLSRYYPEGYYSAGRVVEEGRLKQFFIRRRARHRAGRRNLIGCLYSRIRPAPVAPAWLEYADVGFDDEILDVGSGSGTHLVQLSYLGYSKLTGIDPFIKQDIHYRNGVRVLRRSLEEAEGRHDFVMLHHSLEHMPDQGAAFEHLRRLLAPSGQVLVRIPLAGSFAWRKYRAEWAQLEPPRHLHVHSERGLRLLAEMAGFEVERVAYDSNGFQFWGSEQISRGVPLVDEAAGRIGPRAGLFTNEELSAFEEEAARLNEAGDGDQACFYLRKR